ncbi:MAG: transposase, partial [Thermofilum sp.]|uniref:transposase n=1 Tax=Thermofilum sp. TaxID=1961369 RepID=UPI00258BC66A
SDKGSKSEKVELLLPNWFDYQVKEVKLVYDMNWIEVQVVYEYEKELRVDCNGSYHAGVDIGLDNLLSVVSDNPDVRSFIVSGRELKSYNRWFNKKKAEVRSHMDLVRNMINGERDEERKKDLEKHYLWLKKYFWNLHKARDRKLNTWMHQITRRVADLLYETGHRKIYIGKEGIDKNGISLGKVVNQNYVSIPHRRLVNMLRYKCEELGIEVEEVDERYTSKSSPISDDVVEIQSRRRNGEEVEFSGKREKRGLYKDSVLGKVFNADLVGAMNILKVGAKLRELMLSMKTLLIKLCNPIRFKLLDLIYKSNPESLLIGVGIGDSMPVITQEALALMGGVSV